MLVEEFLIRTSFYLVLIAHLAHCTITAVGTRNVPFDEFRPGSVITPVDKIATVLAKNELKCAIACYYEPECKSFEYCFPAFCSLNRNDIHVLHTEMIRSEGCSYRGMEKDSKPSCIERGGFVNIQNDAASGFCQINQKRIDAYCYLDPDGVITQDQSTQWRVMQRVIYQLPAHRGRHPTCTYGTTGSYDLEWLIWVKNGNEGFNGAVDYCENNYQAALFGDLNGTEDQMEFLISHIDVDIFWLGVQRIGGLWKTTYGDDMTSKIRWNSGTGQPSNQGGENYAMVILDRGVDPSKPYDVIWDAVEDLSRYTYPFICDKMR